MRRRFRGIRGCGTAFVVALVASCSSPSNGGSGVGGPGPTGTPSAYETAVAKAACHAIFECPVANDDITAERILFATESRCVTVVTRALAGGTSTSKQYTDLDRAVAAGTVHQDSAALSRCAGTITSQCYLGDLGAAADCRAVFTGTIPAGGACHRSEECSGDSYCDKNSSNSCDGKCAPRKAEGAECNDDPECSSASGLFAACSEDTSAASGTGRFVCHVVSAEAASATLGAPCERARTAAASRRCASGLWCRPTRDSSGVAGDTGTCAGPIAVGGSCDSGDDLCTGNAYCFGPDGGMTCQSITLAQAGQSCARTDTSFGLCDIFSGLTCDKTTSTCVPTGNGSLGSRCDTTDAGDLIPCQTGLQCDGTTGTCEPVKRAGEDCTRDSECDLGRCDSTTMKCTADYCTN